MLTSYSLPYRKGFLNFCKVLILALVFSSCTRTTYFNTRATAPVFIDSNRVYAEAYIGQGLRQIGANIAYAPIPQVFALAGGNIGLWGNRTWESGLGFVPLKYKFIQLSVLGSYGRSHLNTSFSPLTPSFISDDEYRGFRALYQKFTSTPYITFQPTTKLYITLGVRYNFVQYLKYYEYKHFTRTTPKELAESYVGRDSLKLEGRKSFETLDPFIGINYYFSKYFSISIQSLYSYHTTFTLNNGKGYKNVKRDSYSNPVRHEYTYSTTLPSYKRFVLNLSLVVHFGSKRKTRSDEDFLL